jgi:hypothetical protein
MINRNRNHLAVIALFLTLAVVGAACNKKVQVHPGAVNAFDSQCYDYLYMAQTGIESVRADYVAGRLPKTVKDPLNKTIDAYNVALPAYLAYHASATPQDEASLQNAIQEVIATLAALQTATGKQLIHPVTGGTNGNLAPATKQ